VAYEKEKEEAVKAARLAARLCQSVRRQMVDQDSVEKSDRSPVTVADLGSQALICRHLSEVFGDPIVGEEDAAGLRKAENRPLLESVQGYLREVGIDGSAEEVCHWIDQGNGEVSKRYWTLDPIDGTKGFLRNDQYAVALALIEDGDIKVGVLVCPALPTAEADRGTLMVAVRGEGTEMMSLEDDSGDRVSVDTSSSEESHRFVESVESGHGNQTLQAEVASAVDIHAPSLRMDSQAKYAAVARGDAVLYLRLPSADPNRYAEKIWDHAAGVLVVEEAGGKTTDMHGKPLDFGSGERMTTNQGVVVSNGAIHDDVIAALGRIA
jgi:3'(2'), 5'-bisphosphate nucleotidase